MIKLRLDFINRIISMVSEQKTVIAYMEPELAKKDFLPYISDHVAYYDAERVTFDFENNQICLKKLDTATNEDDIEVLPFPSLNDERHDILKAAGWNEP